MESSKKTTLIYFGDVNNSKYGTIRSAIALFIILIISGIVSYINNDFYKFIMSRKVGSFLCLVIYISAICVHVPSDSFDIVKYGTSIGLLCSMFSVVGGSTKIKCNVITLGCLLSVVVSYLVYELSLYFELYPIAP